MAIRPSLFERLASAARGKPLNGHKRPAVPQREVALYAKVGGPPWWWHEARIIDLDTGREVERVVEANAVEGWVERYASDENGRAIVEGDELKVERLTGRFEIRRCPR